MEDARTIYFDLIKDKNRMRLFTLGVCALAGFVSLCALAFAYKVHNDSANNMYAVSQEGNVSKLEKVKVITQIPDEARFHIEYLMDTYYSYNFQNMERQRENALQIIDEIDGKALEKKWEKWHSNVRGESLDVRTTFEPETFDIKLINEENFLVNATGLMKVTNGGVYSTYRLKIETKLLRVDRSFPWNPHGFICYNFKDGIEEIEKNIKVKNY